MPPKHHGMKERMQHVMGGHTHKTKKEEFQDEVDGPLPDLEDLMNASLPTKLHTMKVMQAKMLQNQKAEPTIQFVKALAAAPLKSHHGEVTAMGVPRADLPHWDSIQFVVSQMAEKPLMDFDKVDTTTVIGPNAKRPLVLKIPLFVSDMSYGAISEEAKMALARGAELAGTGICSGEGGMLPTEKAENSRYLYELASGRFGWDMNEIPAIVQAFHFKGGQGAKTGTGGHLPGKKVVGKIAQVRKLKPGTDAISPPTFTGTDLVTPQDFRRFADQVRAKSGGIPIGFKLSAQHIEDDIDFALAASADYIILDGRGGATGAAPTIFRDHISVPTIPALARARRHLDKLGVGRSVSLIITGGLRMPADFAKAMAMGADAIAISNSAIQSIGCVAARMCFSNKCPAGVATQDEVLRARLNVDTAAPQLANFFNNSVHLMSVLARACGHSRLKDFAHRDLTTWNHDMSRLTAVSFGGVGSPCTEEQGQGEKEELKNQVKELRSQVEKLTTLMDRLEIPEGMCKNCFEA